MHKQLLISILLFVFSSSANAIEEASYRVIEKEENFEIREYSPNILAEVIVQGSLEEAGNRAFKELFRYISGGNTSTKKIENLNPLIQKEKGEKIDMTAPVGQQEIDGKWAVSFMMPQAYTLDTLPKPDNPEIKLRQVPARKIASIRYSGTWSEESYLDHKAKLEEWISKRNLLVTGKAIWARYNAPFIPWFLRRNEVLIPITQ